MSTTITAKKHQTFTISIESVLVGLPSVGAIIKTANAPDGSHWNVVLSQQEAILNVDVSLSQASYPNVPLDQQLYKYMHLVPHKGNKSPTTTTVNTTSSLQGQSSVRGTIPAKNVITNDRYFFDIVFSSIEKPEMIARFSEVISKNRDIMLTLLKDIQSVDVCFVFESDKTYSNFGLWGHRAILSRYKLFAAAIQEATKNATKAAKNATETTSAASSDTDTEATAASCTAGRDDSPAVLTIPVKSFSLATFSVLLRYIYSGEVTLIPDLTKHAISITKSALILYNTQGTTRESIQWNPLDPESPWKLKDVAWEDLVLAAEFYGVTDMQTCCEQAVIDAMDEHNAVETLFNIGCCSAEVKEKAMTFIVTNISSLIGKEKDPFASFRDHPQCHDFMMEIMRRRLEKA
ncbi:hypothetical protein EDD11_001967 [Mortierella claussenii]|nr:hypothetical protein EDD11_001967 [Mortierella claussenii]